MGWVEEASLADRTFVVTGAASGIGAETTAELMRRGAYVIGVDRTRVDEADEWRSVDLLERSSIADLVESLPSGLNGLANIAGLPPSAPPADVLKVNLRSLQILTESVVPKLADGASIVNLASSAANRWKEGIDQIIEFESVEWDDIEAFAERHEMGDVGRSYFFSKEGLVVWTMKNRWTWIDRGIRINAISPGPVDTPILSDFIATLGPRAERSLNATERLGRPSDIAPVVAFLLSDGSAWFRGSNLTPDGGLSSHMILGELGLADKPS